MKRRFLLQVVNGSVPSGAVKRKKRLEIELGMRQAFYEGHVELYGNAPVDGNPLFDLYRPMLTGGPFLRFKNPGLGADTETRVSESQRLGRICGRAYLRQHLGYRWFAHVSNLARWPQDGWSARRRDDGNMPDWLVAGTPAPAVAEAKGTRRSVHETTSVLKDWRRQVQNVVVTRNGVEKALKTWILATRWVTTEQPRTHPKIYAEDPPLPGSELTSDESASLERWIATTNTAANLIRLQQEALALRIAHRSRGTEDARSNVMLWRAQAPELSHRHFVGVPRVAWGHTMQMLFWWSLADLFGWPEHFLERRIVRELLRHEVRGFFEGLDLQVIQAVLRGETPEPTDQVEAPVFPFDAVYLSDGSLFAPLRMMAPVEAISL